MVLTKKRLKAVFFCLTRSLSMDVLFCTCPPPSHVHITVRRYVFAALPAWVQFAHLSGGTNLVVLTLPPGQALLQLRIHTKLLSEFHPEDLDA